MPKKSDSSDAPPHSAEVLAAILDEVGAYIFTKDAQGRYTYGNRRVLELFNISLSELVGRKDDDFFDLVHSNELYLNDLKVLEQAIAIEEEEVNVIKETGEKRIYLSTKKPLKNSQGQITGLIGIATDITERKRLEETSKTQHRLLETIMNNIDAHIYMKDADHRFQYANYKVGQLFEMSPEEIIGKKDTEIMSQEYADKVSRLDKDVFATGQAQTGQEDFPDKQGHLRHYWSVKVPIDLTEDQKMLIGFSTDITELHDLQTKLQQQAITDYLTGLHNRRFLFDALAKELARASRHRLVTSLLSLDIDLFKAVNDQYGHPAGDTVLTGVAQIIQANLREEDTAARMGGEEFSVLLPNTDLEQAKALAERIRQAIESQSISVDKNIDLNCTVSIGVASTSEGINDVDKLYSAADKKLYLAKSSGRNGISG